MADASTSPLRWLIGSELKRYRVEAGMTYAATSKQTGISQPKLAHLEVGRQQQDPDDIATLLNAYGAQARDIDRLTTLTGRADEATWWAAWAQVVPDWLRTFVGLEGLAERETTFEPLIIPGLLQTQEYAAAVTANSVSIRPDHGERFVGFRVARARRLTDPERPLALHAIVTESALRLAVGTPQVRKDQLRHLLDVMDLPTVTIQVLRPEDGPHPGLTSGSFVLLDFGAASRTVIYHEMKDGAIYLQDADRVNSYTMVADNLRQVALGPEQSASLIASMLG